MAGHRSATGRATGPRPADDEPASEEDDASLVARCLGDDDGAWDTLVARYGPLAWGVIRRAGLHEDDAADVYQTVWLAAFEQLPRLRDPARFPGWIARMSHIQALRLRRGYGISRRVMSRLPVREDDDRVPEAEIVALEDRSRVAAALSTIGERCARLLRVLYFESPAPAYQEISARLSMPVGSIGPTRARCLERLARTLRIQPEDLP